MISDHFGFAVNVMKRIQCMMKLPSRIWYCQHSLKEEQPFPPYTFTPIIKVVSEELVLQPSIIVRPETWLVHLQKLKLRATFFL
jgi:hypothetical protein